MNKQKIISFLFFAIFFAFLFYIFYLARAMLAPVIFAIILSYMLNPLVSYLETFKIKRTFAIVLVYIFLLVSFLLSLFLLVPNIVKEVSLMSRSIPKYLQTGQEFLEEHKIQNLLNLDKILTNKTSDGKYDIGQDKKQSFSVALDLFKDYKIGDKIIDFFNQMLIQLFVNLPNILLNIISFLSYFVLVPFFSFFILKDGHKIKKGIISFIPNQYFEFFIDLSAKINFKLNAYLVGQLTISFVFFLLSFLILSFLNVPYAILIAIVAGITNMIPYLGPIFGTSLAVIITLLDTGNTFMAIKVVIAFLILQSLDAFLISPSIVSKKVNIHPLVIFFALTIGGVISGIFGMLIAIPCVATIDIILKETYQELKKRAIL